MSSRREPRENCVATAQARFRIRSGEKGIALVLVLWLLVLLSILALSFTGAARTQARIARNLHDNAEARWMADAGVHLSLRRLWTAGDGAGPAANGRKAFCRFRAGILAISVQNISGLIDLNAAPEGMLAKLLAVSGVDEADARRLAARIADFRDSDDVLRPDGAEAAEYAAAGLDHGPKNRAIQATEELEQVPGLPPALLERLRPSVTVHSGRPNPDLRYAPPQVRLALGQLLPGPDTNPSGTGPAGDGAFIVTVTARTAAGAFFTREAALSVKVWPSPGYRVLRWGRTASPAEHGADVNDLPPC